MSAEDGGPAFPTREKIGESFDDETGRWYDEFGDFGGMTIRDYFAAKAMQSFAAVAGFSHSPNDKQIAAYSYAMADAMLKERDK